MLFPKSNKFLPASKIERLKKHPVYTKTEVFRLAGHPQSIQTQILGVHSDPERFGDRRPTVKPKDYQLFPISYAAPTNLYC